MDRRTGIVIALTTALVMTGGAAVLQAQTEGGDGSNSGRLNRQGFKWVTEQLTTDSTEFIPMIDPSEPPLVGNGLAMRGPLSITFSGDFSGAEVEVQALIGDKVLRPGKAHFDPRSGTTSFSYTFVGQAKQAGCWTYGMQWRSPSGKAVTLNHASTVINYNRVAETKRGFQLPCP